MIDEPRAVSEDTGPGSALAPWQERTNPMGLLEGKVGIIYGVANHRSIAWAIAQAVDAEGASLILTYVPRMERDVRRLAEQLGRPAVRVPCDVQDDAQIASVYQAVGQHHPRLDFLVHAVAFAS